MTSNVPKLDPELEARVTVADMAIPHVLDAAKGLRHDHSEAHVHALALYGTIIELCSACVLLVKFGEPSGVPILLRSMYEALIDLENLLRDPTYVEHIEAANLLQTIRIMKSGPLREGFSEGRKAEFDEYVAKLAALEAKGKGPLKIRRRCEKLGKLDQYESLYGLFCLDAHNNASALAERHLSEQPDGNFTVSFFGDYDVQAVAGRVDFSLQFLFEAAIMIHGAFKLPAPQIEKLAADLDGERRSREAGSPNRAAREPPDSIERS